MECGFGGIGTAPTSGGPRRRGRRARGPDRGGGRGRSCGLRGSLSPLRAPPLRLMPSAHRPARGGRGLRAGVVRGGVAGTRALREAQPFLHLAAAHRHPHRHFPQARAAQLARGRRAGGGIAGPARSGQRSAAARSRARRRGAAGGGARRSGAGRYLRLQPRGGGGRAGGGGGHLQGSIASRPRLPARVFTSSCTYPPRAASPRPW